MHSNAAGQMLHIPDGVISEKLTLIFPERRRPTLLALAAYEENAWMFMVGCVAGQEPPADLAAMIATVTDFAPQGLFSALHASEPLGEVVVTRNFRGVWRRYDKMSAFPAGMLVIGDAVCSFNPLYGQGMTVAALQAVALRDCLSCGDADLGHRFFGAASQVIRPIWASNQANDRYMTKPTARRSIPHRITDWQIEKVLNAAKHDTIVTEKLFRAAHLIDPPARLRDPSVLARVALSNLKAPTKRSRVSASRRT
jgi:hypothetical protein